MSGTFVLVMLNNAFIPERGQLFLLLLAVGIECVSLHHQVLDALLQVKDPLLIQLVRTVLQRLNLKHLQTKSCDHNH